MSQWKFLGCELKPGLVMTSAMGAVLIGGLPFSSSHAQSAQPWSSYFAVEDGTKRVPSLALTVADLDGMSIRYETMKVGEVSDVLADASGNIVAVVAAYGGMFGLFDNEVVLPISHLKRQQGYLQSDMPPDKMAGLPNWE